jgi:hypothetical protein
VDAPHISFSMPEPIFMKLGMYILAPEPISAAYFINPCHQFMSVCVSPTVARQRIVKNVTVVTSKHAAIEEVSDAPCPMKSMSYKRKIGD